jgi:hypothetical protein
VHESCDLGIDEIFRLLMGIDEILRLLISSMRLLRLLISSMPRLLIRLARRIPERLFQSLYSILEV